MEKLDQSRPDHEAVWARYLRLPPGPKTVLQLKSLIFLPTNKSIFSEIISRSGAKAPEGRAWTNQSINAALDVLSRERLLTDELACVPAALHRVAIDTMSAPDGEQFVAAVRRAFATSTSLFYISSTHIDTTTTIRLGRLAVYANNDSDFIAQRDKHDALFAPHRLTSIFAELLTETPLDIDWLGSRKPAIQAALLEGLMEAFLGGALEIPGWPLLLARFRQMEGAQGFRPVRRVLLQHDLLALRLDEARTLSGKLEPADSKTRQTAEAALAFLAGDNVRSIDLYRGALKALRKEAGKRKLFLPDAHGLLFVMALLRANDAKLHSEIQAAIDLLPLERRSHSVGWIALQVILCVAQGLDGKARELVERFRRVRGIDPLSEACLVMAAYIVDQAIIADWIPHLTKRFLELKDNIGLPARIIAEVLAEVSPEPASARDFLEQTAGSCAVTFTQLLGVSSPWERALQSLDAVIFVAPSKGPREAPARPGKRLAWFVDPETLAIDVAEQSAKSRDGWTDGKPVALKRLYGQDPRLDYLTNDDRRALRGMRREKVGWHKEDYSYDFDPARVLPALIGHPAVFDARRRQHSIEFVSYPVELVITEKGGNYRIALSHTADVSSVFLEAETPTRYRVVEMTDRVLGVQRILGTKGLVAPKAARDRVVALARRADPLLPIRAEIEAIEADAIEGIATPVAQLLSDGDPALDGGLKVTLLVRPFGKEGPTYVAGLGGRSALASIAGKQVRVRRDLEAERAARRALVEACPSLNASGADQAQEVFIAGLEACLELMLELQAQGDKVVVEWPEGRKLKVGEVTPRQVRFKVRQLREWFAVEGDVQVDDQEVLEMRFLLDRLDRARGRFVPLEEGRFVALTQRLQAQLRQLASITESDKTGRRVSRLGAAVVGDLLEEAGKLEADTAWRKHVTRLREAVDWTPEVPVTLEAELRPYQEEGFTWLARLARLEAGGCLADDMGLGKTVQAIALMLHRAADGPCLVVAPTSVLPNWASEILRFAPTLNAHRLGIANDRAELVAKLGPRDVLLCSYGLLPQADELLTSQVWSTVVLDEAQAIKNAETRRARVIHALQARFRVALTGTPVENDLTELWSLFNFAVPHLLGSREKFQQRFAGPIERDRDPAARSALKALLRPFLLRRTKAAVLAELPSRTEQTIVIEMEPDERAFYEALRQKALAAIAALDAQEGRRKIHILAELMRLRRACCNPGLIDPQAAVPSGKLAALLDLVDELRAGNHRALVFSQFTGHLELVRKALEKRGVTCAYLDGSTPAAERERRVASFQAGEADLFLISLRAGGTGLNLTAADYVVHLDPWWNPAVEDQASDRAHRIGQTRPVTIYRLIMADSIESRIVELHRAKRELATDFLEGADAAGRLTEQQLLGLIGG